MESIIANTIIHIRVVLLIVNFSHCCTEKTDKIIIKIGSNFKIVYFIP